jgi:uncharacterized protein (TIGR03435 family)
MTIAGVRVTLKWAGLCNLIARAYDLRDYAISGPKSIMTPDPSSYYDIQAKAADEAGPLTVERIRPMLRALLTERFQLRVHRQMKQLPVYSLVIGKSGAKLSLSAKGPCAVRPNVALIVGAGISSCKPQMTMAEFAERLSHYTDRPVVDKTGIDGGQVFELTFPPGTPLLDKPQPDWLASLFTNVQEQLGLKLEATTGPVAVLVIDSIERPSEN